MILTCILHVLLPEPWQGKPQSDDDSLETESKDIPIDLSYIFFGNTDKINQEKIAKKSQLVPLPNVDHHFIGRKQLVEEQKNPELLRLRVRAQPSEADKVSECLNEKMETIRCKTR